MPAPSAGISIFIPTMLEGVGRQDSLAGARASLRTHGGPAKSRNRALTGRFIVFC